MDSLLNRGAAAVALVTVSPLLAVAALCIWLEDRGDVLFRQTRVGQHGRRFTLFKLRSMYQTLEGRPITKQGDPRITRVGRILRKYKLDELPQLWNVIRAEMNFIGPRPEVPVYVDESNPIWREVLKTKPGITDLATLAFRNEEADLAKAANMDRVYREEILPAKLSLNLLYGRSRTLLTDAKLLGLTIRYSLLPGGFERADVIRAVTTGAAGRQNTKV